MAGRGGKQSANTALGGVMAAGSLVVLWLACVAPSGRIGLTAAAGLFPMAATLCAGRTAGCLCWAAASLLGLFMLPDKGVALLFLAFLGLYPVIKGRIETLDRRAVIAMVQSIRVNGKNDLVITFRYLIEYVKMLKRLDRLGKLPPDLREILDTLLAMEKEAA